VSHQRTEVNDTWQAMSPSRPDLRGALSRAEHLAKWAVLGALVGVVAGLSSYAFLESLRWATDARVDHPWLPWTLPAVGFVVALAYHHLGGRSAGGNNLLLEEIHQPQAWVPRRMAPLIYASTVVGHLAGASIGREGTALQMAGGLTDGAARLAKVSGDTRRVLLITALAGGFSAVFGVPLAGCVFALEVQAVGRLRYDALVPCLAAAVVGDRIVQGLGYHHSSAGHLIGDVDLTAGLLAKVVVAAIAFGLVATSFSVATHAVEQASARLVTWPPLRAALGGVAILALMGLAGTRAYLGLSTDLADAALAGATGVTFAFAWKLGFTAVSLGTGFRGGEVTPLFVIGATLGATLGSALHAPVPLFAAIGFVAVFGAAANTPLACAVMGLELFGASVAVPVAIACVVAYACSAHQGIYASQRVEIPKSPHHR
jgi:H+/Cl- antiporter ClcA